MQPRGCVCLSCSTLCSLSVCALDIVVGEFQSLSRLTRLDVGCSQLNRTPELLAAISLLPLRSLGVASLSLPDTWRNTVNAMTSITSLDVRKTTVPQHSCLMLVRDRARLAHLKVDQITQRMLWFSKNVVKLTISAKNPSLVDSQFQSLVHLSCPTLDLQSIKLYTRSTFRHRFVC